MLLSIAKCIWTSKRFQWCSKWGAASHNILSPPTAVESWINFDCICLWKQPNFQDHGLHKDWFAKPIQYGRTANHFEIFWDFKRQYLCLIYSRWKLSFCITWTKSVISGSLTGIMVEKRGATSHAVGDDVTFSGANSQVRWQCKLI